MATHSSIFAWTEDTAGLQFMGSQRVGHDWATNTHTLVWNFGPSLARTISYSPSTPNIWMITKVKWMNESSSWARAINCLWENLAKKKKKIQQNKIFILSTHKLGSEFSLQYLLSHHPNTGFQMTLPLHGCWPVKSPAWCSRPSLITIAIIINIIENVLCTMHFAECSLLTYSLLTTIHETVWWMKDGYKFFDILPTERWGSLSPYV